MTSSRVRRGTRISLSPSHNGSWWQTVSWKTHYTPATPTSPTTTTLHHHTTTAPPPYTSVSRLLSLIAHFEPLPRTIRRALARCAFPLLLLPHLYRAYGAHCAMLLRALSIIAPSSFASPLEQVISAISPLAHIARMRISSLLRLAHSSACPAHSAYRVCAASRAASSLFWRIRASA